MSAFVVDDEELIASTLELILIHKGFKARAFVDAVDALCAARSASHDFLLADVMMPGVNGIELAMQMTQLHPTCEVLLFSGQTATNGMLTEAASVGQHFEILPKPVHPTELLEKIDQLFAA